MTRRGANEGTIRQRPNGTWEARYRTPDGRQHSVYAPTRREVQDKLRGALTHTEHGVKPVSQQLTVAAYLDDWLKTSVRARCRKSTADNYAVVVDAYLKPALGRVPLARLEPEHVQRMLADLTARSEPKPLSPTTVRYCYSVLRIALGRALKTGKVLRNVATLVDPPAKARRELAPLSAAQVATFLRSVEDDRLSALYVTAVALGLRQGELLALRWSDVDFDRGLLSVQHTLERRTRRFADPKTDRARRTLTMPARVVDALREHRKRQLDEGSSGRDGLVFTSMAGTALDSRNVTRRFQAALERAGLPRQPFHHLRHACATLLIEDGEELSVVSRLLGHSDPQRPPTCTRT